MKDLKDLGDPGRDRGAPHNFRGGRGGGFRGRGGRDGRDERDGRGGREDETQDERWERQRQYQSDQVCTRVFSSEKGAW